MIKLFALILFIFLILAIKIAWIYVFFGKHEEPIEGYDEIGSFW
jgi:hypothetical protein